MPHINIPLGVMSSVHESSPICSLPLAVPIPTALSRLARTMRYLMAVEGHAQLDVVLLVSRVVTDWLVAWYHGKRGRQNPKPNTVPGLEQFAMDGAVDLNGRLD